MLKQCTKCGEWKDEEEFAYRNKALNTRHSICKECKKEYNKRTYKNSTEAKEVLKGKKKKQEAILKDYINEVKANGCCAICGDNRPYVLDFHHLYDKSFNIGNAPDRNISINTLKNEIDKCILVCANCHREIHYKER